MIGLSRPSLAKVALTGAALLFLVLGLAGFWLTEGMESIRLILVGIGVGGVLLALTGRDRVLLSLVAVYTLSLTALYILFNQLLPVWVLFPLMSVLMAVLLLFPSEDPGKPQWVAAIGAGIIVTQLIWVLSLWPFDPKSKAAIVALSAYGLSMYVRDGLTVKESPRWVGAVVWMLLVLVIVLWFAEWYA